MMKKPGKLITFFFTLTGTTFSAWAGIHAEATRVIYISEKKSASLPLENIGETPYLIQSWLDSGDPLTIPKNLPLQIVPPLMKLDGGEQGSVRIVYAGHGLPTDRESVFWINIQEVPPKTQLENTLQIAVHSRLKVFYRPAAIKQKLQESAKMLQWRRVNDTIIVNNPSPLSVSLATLQINNRDGRVVKVNADIILPFNEEKISLPTTVGNFSTLDFSYVNDYGAVSTVENVPLNAK